MPNQQTEELIENKVRVKAIWSWIRLRSVTILIYLLATLLTDAFFMGDTAD